MQQTQQHSLGDFLSPKIIAISLLSFLITSAILFTLAYLLLENTGSIKELMPELFNMLDRNIFSKLEDAPLMGFLIEHKAIMLLFKGMIFFGLGVVAYYLFFGLYGLIVSLFSGIIIRIIQKKYYPGLTLKGIGITSTLFFYLKTIIITVLLFILFSPTLLIPAVNLLIFMPVYYFFHKMLVFDVSSNINTTKEYRKIRKLKWSELKAHTTFCFLLTLIPVLGILLYPYYVIYTGHYILHETKKLRYEEDFQALKRANK